MCAFFNKKMIFSISIGVFFVLWQLVISLKEQNYLEQLLIEETKIYLEYSPVSVYNGSLLTSNYSVAQDVFFFLLPFLVSFPSILDSFKRDSKDSNNMIIILGQAFISGTMIGFILIIENYLISSMFLPSVKPEIFSGYFPIIDSTLGKLYYNYPMCYIVLYGYIDMFFCGIFSAFYVTISRMCTYILEALMLPLIFSFVIRYFGMYNMNLNYYIPTNHLRPSQAVCSLDFNIIITDAIVLISIIVVINYILYKYKGRGK